MKVSVDLDLCVGHARCQNRCPEVFGTDDVFGKCVILMDEIPPDLQEKARLGVKNCPERAIKIVGE